MTAPALVSWRSLSKLAKRVLRNVDVAMDVVPVLTEVLVVPRSVRRAVSDGVSRCVRYEIGHLYEGQKLTSVLEGAPNKPMRAAPDVRLPTPKAAVEPVCDEVMGLPKRVVLAVNDDDREPWSRRISPLDQRGESDPEPKPVCLARVLRLEADRENSDLSDAGDVLKRIPVQHSTGSLCASRLSCAIYRGQGGVVRGIALPPEEFLRVELSLPRVASELVPDEVSPSPFGAAQPASWDENPGYYLKALLARLIEEGHIVFVPQRHWSTSVSRTQPVAKGRPQKSFRPAKDGPEGAQSACPLPGADRAIIRSCPAKLLLNPDGCQTPALAWHFVPRRVARRNFFVKGSDPAPLMDARRRPPGCHQTSVVVQAQAIQPLLSGLQTPHPEAAAWLSERHPTALGAPLLVGAEGFEPPCDDNLDGQRAGTEHDGLEPLTRRLEAERARAVERAAKREKRR